MKTFTFRYAPKRESMSKRLLKAAKSGKAEVRPDLLECASFKDLLEIATESRLKLLETIIKEKPTSLYELAKLVEKDQAYVMREAKVLSALGLIDLQKENSDGRERLKPVSLYDNVVIDCGLSDKASA